MKITAWQLFNRNFKKDDEVIIINEYDAHAWGRLVFIANDRFTLRRPDGRTRTFFWDDIRFMAHDGFPVRALMGADGSATIEQQPTAKDVLRKAMQTEYRSISFGDPFVISAQILPAEWCGALSVPSHLRP